MWWIIGLSIPIFYFYGIISFILFIVRRAEKKTTPPPTESVTSQEQFHAKFILELEDIQSKTPAKTISEIIQEYKQKLKTVVAVQSIPLQTYQQAAPVTQTTESLQPASVPLAIKKDLSEASSNWYSENAISLLLYVGAFFIVASASIFVGFQWETIGGVVKALVISILTLAFFGTGLYCYGIPKIKTAGRVFIAIAALLIPFCGLAWYNFVLKDAGYTFGSVWLITSVVALATYISLAYYLKHTFYPYIISVSALSLMFSIVNVNGLESDYYILFGIVTAFILSISGMLLKNADSEVQTIFKFPLEISSQVMMPLVLLYGLSVAIADDKLLTAQGTISLLLASAFYLTDYLINKRLWSLAAAQLLFPFTVIVFFNWQGYDTLLLLYVLSLLSFTDLCLSFIFNKFGLLRETDISAGLGIIKLLLIFLISFGFAPDPIHNVLFATLPALAGVLIMAIKRDVRHLALTSAFTGITIYLYLNMVLKLEDPRYTAYIFVAIGLLCYALTIKYKQTRDLFQIMAISTTGYLAVALLLSLEHAGTLTILNCSIAAILTSATYFFTNKNFIYAGNVMIIFALVSLLKYLNADIAYTPLIFTAVSFAFFTAGQMLPESVRQQYRYTALLTNIGTPIVFGLLSIDNTRQDYSYYYGLQAEPSGTGNTFENNALISAYAAICMTALDAVQRNSTLMKYVSSAVAMCTYLWQIKVLDVTETQMYTVPLGIYFMVLAYIQRLKNNTEKWNLLNALGLFLLIVPGIFQSFDIAGAGYALLIGAIGIIILSLGLSLNYRLYIYVGIATLVLAVLSQTYEYLSSLPRWIITGAVGIGFLGTATYLLQHRKDPPEHN